MIKRTISTSDQLAEVSPAAREVFVFLLPHLDAEGRADGNPGRVKGTAVPLFAEQTVGTVREALGELARVGLVRWYTTPVGLAVAYPGFHRQQPYINRAREARSKFPAPPALPEGVLVPATIPEPLEAAPAAPAAAPEPSQPSAGIPDDSATTPRALREDSATTPRVIREDSGPKEKEKQNKDLPAVDPAPSAGKGGRSKKNGKPTDPAKSAPWMGAASEVWREKFKGRHPAHLVTVMRPVIEDLDGDVDEAVARLRGFLAEFEAVRFVDLTKFPTAHGSYATTPTAERGADPIDRAAGALAAALVDHPVLRARTRSTLEAHAADLARQGVAPEAEALVALLGRAGLAEVREALDRSTGAGAGLLASAMREAVAANEWPEPDEHDHAEDPHVHDLFTAPAPRTAAEVAA